MVINSITIENVKGIERLEIKQTIQPNRPNILVAPNGFGKSSIAIAFNSLKANKIDLADENMHNGNKALTPTISLKLSTGKEIEANVSKNTIKEVFSVFVVNSQLKPTAKAQRIGNYVTAKASMNISPTIVFKTIPSKVTFSYSIRTIKKDFGTNGKILIDISPLFNNVAAILNIEEKVNFNSFTTKGLKNEINKLVQIINAAKGKNIDSIRYYITEKNILNISSEDLSSLVSLMKTYLHLTDSIDAFGAAWQYLHVRNTMKNSFKKAIAYADYLCKKKLIDKTLENLNPTNGRFEMVSKEKNNSLIIEWPKAHLISNGQRDILVFIAKLMECEFQTKNNCILIIDEFFDYLDDANVVAFQYYVSTLIDIFKKNKRIIFPILLTHLDPNYLKHFCFNSNRMNVCYLKDVNATISSEMRKLVAVRDMDCVKDDLDRYYFHYNPNGESINLKEQFEALNLNVAWSIPTSFRKKVDRQCRTYILEPNKKFDPLAVCFSIRAKIEENAYTNLQNEEDKKKFLETHTTNAKLQFAQSRGVSIPETYFLLGIIYNHPLHICGDEDISKPLGIKLENPIIKNMIYNLWQNL